MNHIYRVIRSSTHGALIAVAESAVSGRNRRRSLRRLALLLSGPLALLPVAVVCAAPVGGQVSAGSGQITQNGNTTTIQQGSDRLAINWNSFNVGINESVRFNQPNANAIALNRVLGQDPSKILGNLSANGQVFILNPNGVLFGSSAQVNVGGLVATTLKLSDSDFMSGKYVFSQTPGQAAASVANQGSITANGGYIALLAPQVINQGTLTANGGNVSLAAGTQMTLTLASHSLLTLSIDQGAVDALAANHNLIQADGGVVLLSSKGQDAVLSGVVNNSGVIQARTVSNQGGEIRLLAQGGSVQVDGTLDASAAGSGNGGFIETSGDKIKVADSVKITTAATNGNTGTWLIDPNDLIIANNGGDISATNLNNQLASNNVTLNTVMGHVGNGDIFVNDALNWSAATTLSLQADRNISINAAINGAQGGLTLNAGNTISAPAAVKVNTFTLDGGNWIQNSAALAAFSAQDFRINNGSFLRVAGGDGSRGNAWQIADVYGLQGMGSSAALLSSSYRLINNIDASTTSGWNGGAGFVSVGSGSAAFTGNFEGQGHTISNMTIKRPTENYVGLFGMIDGGGSISNIGMVGGSFVGAGYVGPLAGALKDGTIRNAYASGNASGNAGSSNFIGGLVGVNYQSGSISQSYATGAVSGAVNVGGLVGWNYGRIDQAYASGTVVGQLGVGGLVGISDGGQISNAYATGAVSGVTGVGGLIGNIQNGGQISNTYATGVVRGTGSNVGGLAGSNTGANVATITASYWNTQTSGQGSSAGGEGRLTQEMQGAGSARPTYVGWDFATVWARGTAYPAFSWQPAVPPVVVIAPPVVATAPPAVNAAIDGINAVLAGVLTAPNNAPPAAPTKLISTIGVDPVTGAVTGISLPASGSETIIANILKDLAQIDAENAAFIAAKKAQIEAMSNSGSIDPAVLANHQASAAEIASKLDAIISDLAKGAITNPKSLLAEIEATIAAANAKIKAPPNVNKTVPLTASTDSAMAAAKANELAKLEAAKAASGTAKAAAEAAAKQKLQVALAALADAKAKIAQTAAAVSVIGAGRPDANLAGAAQGTAQTSDGAARIAAGLAAAEAAAATATTQRPNRAAGTNLGNAAIGPSLSAGVTSGTTPPANAAGNRPSAQNPVSAASEALLKAGADMQQQAGNISSNIADLLRDGAKPSKP